MNNGQNQFGDEDFIYEKSMEAEPPPKHENNIYDGFIIINYEKIPVKRRYLLDKKISAVMPEEFEIMSKEDADIKYPSIHRPEFIYTNEDTTVNFLISYKTDTVSNEEVPLLRDAIQAAALKMRPSSSVIESETIEISGGNISYYDTVAPAIDADIYTLTFLFSLNGRSVIGACSCPSDGMEEWKPVFLQMLGSVEIK